MSLTFTKLYSFDADLILFLILSPCSTQSHTCIDILKCLWNDQICCFLYMNHISWNITSVSSENQTSQLWFRGSSPVTVKWCIIVLDLACPSLEEPLVCISSSSEFCEVFWVNLKSVMVIIFTPQESENLQIRFFFCCCFLFLRKIY